MSCLVDVWKATSGYGLDDSYPGKDVESPVPFLSNESYRFLIGFEETAPELKGRKCDMNAEVHGSMKIKTFLYNLNYAFMYYMFACDSLV